MNDATQTRHVKLRAAALALSTLLLSASGCGEGTKAGGGPNTSGNVNSQFVQVRHGEVITAEDARRPGSTGARTPSNNTRTPSNTTQPMPVDLSPGTPPGTNPGTSSGGSVWAVILQSIATDDHREMAHRVRQQIVAAAPQLQSAIWVHTDSKGSAILYGQFQSMNDDAAQSALRAVKEITVGDRQPFKGSLLGKIDLTSATAAMHPYDLRSLRRQFPNVEPLYTLDVAVWLAPDDDDRAWQEAKKRAEAYAAQLRAAGHEAWFYHADDRMVTSVTVGKFDRTSIDQASGLFSIDVRQLMGQFPKRLVNGEELLERKVMSDAESEMVPQAPQLVEVPRRLD